MKPFLVHGAILVTLALSGCGGSPGAAKPTAQAASSTPVEDHSLQRVRKAGTLRWGADVVGGIPYVYEDPKKPGSYIGFEKEIAEGIARRLGVRLELVVKAWDTLIPELQRGTYDMAMNGIEDTGDRSRIVLFSNPYYVYSQQLTVRRETQGVRSLADLHGRRVGTLSGTAAEDLLRQEKGIDVVVNSEITYSYRDLVEGKIDAVLLDKPIAVAYGATNPRLKNVGESFQEGRYVVTFRRSDASLREAVNKALSDMRQSGELKAIYERYGIMDAHQAAIGISG